MLIRPFDQSPDDCYIERLSNHLFDYIMPSLTPTSWMVLCLIIRKTTGWHKEKDSISIGDIKRGTGIKSDTTVVKAVNELVSKNYILAIRNKETRKPNSYILNTSLEIEIETTPKNEVVNPDTTSINGVDNPPTTPKNEVEEGQTTPKNGDTKDVVLPVIDFGTIVERWTENLGDLGQREAEMLSDYYDDNPQWLSMAIDETIVAKPAKPFPYFRKIINSWIKAGGPIEKEPTAPIHKNGPSKQPKLSAPIDLERLKKLQQEEL